MTQIVSSFSTNLVQIVLPLTGSGRFPKSPVTAKWWGVKDLSFSLGYPGGVRLAAKNWGGQDQILALTVLL
jgi:hypothetical protein